MDKPCITWFRQIIPTGCQLIHFLEGMQHKCAELNEFQDYDFEDDSLDGCITLSDKRCPLHTTLCVLHTPF